MNRREMDYGKPAHAELLLRDLECASDVHAVLLRYVPLLSADGTLMNAYLHLSFSPEASDFLSIPSRAQALSAISQEYEVLPCTASCNSDLDLRQNLARTYYDLGLGPLATFPDFEPAQECYLTEMWGKGEATPKLLRSASTRGSQFATPSSWVSNADSDSESGVRGLKRLSALVKSVLSGRPAIPHKEVVARVLQEVNRSGELKDKEEKNIKRRLYDAINVLMAVGVVVKEGKTLTWKGANLGRRTSASVLEKESQLRTQVAQYLSVKWLLQRNSTGSHACDLQFPFVLFATPDSPDNSVRFTQISVVANRTATKVRISFARDFQSMGEIDVLVHLAADAIDRRTALGFLPDPDLLHFASID